MLMKLYIFFFSCSRRFVCCLHPFFGRSARGRNNQKICFLFSSMYFLLSWMLRNMSLSPCVVKMFFFFFVGPINFHSILRTYSRRPGDLISTGQGVVLFSSKQSRRPSPSGPGFSFKPSDDTTVIKWMKRDSIDVDVYIVILCQSHRLYIIILFFSSLCRRDLRFNRIRDIGPDTFRDMKQLNTL